LIGRRYSQLRYLADIVRERRISVVIKSDQSLHRPPCFILDFVIDEILHAGLERQIHNIKKDLLDTC